MEGIIVALGVGVAILAGLWLLWKGLCKLVKDLHDDINPGED
jgi:hypothetical protein